MKKFIALMLTTAMTLSTGVGATTSTNYHLGDVNGNCDVEIGDALEILTYLADMPQSKIFNDDNAYKSACITGDEPVIGDALQILMKVAGMKNLIDQKATVPLAPKETTEPLVSSMPDETASPPVTTTMPDETTEPPVTTTMPDETTEPPVTTKQDENNGENKNMQSEIVFVKVGFYPCFVNNTDLPKSYGGYFIENNGTVRKFSFGDVYENWTFGCVSMEEVPKTISLNETLPQEKLLSLLSDVSKFEIIGNISEKELKLYISYLTHIDTNVKIQMDISRNDVVQGYTETFGVRYDNDNNAEVVFLNGIGTIINKHPDKNAIELSRFFSVYK